MMICCLCFRRRHFQLPEFTTFRLRRLRTLAEIIYIGTIELGLILATLVPWLQVSSFPWIMASDWAPCLGSLLSFDGLIQFLLAHYYGKCVIRLLINIWNDIFACDSDISAINVSELVPMSYNYCSQKVPSYLDSFFFLSCNEKVRCIAFLLS